MNGGSMNIADIFNFALKGNVENSFNRALHIARKRGDIRGTRIRNINNREGVPRRYARSSVHISLLELGIFKQEPRRDLVGAVGLLPCPRTEPFLLHSIKRAGAGGDSRI